MDDTGLDDRAARDALARLPASIGLGSDAVLRRLDGMTNEVYEVTDGGRSWVLRVPGVGIGADLDRAAERHNAEAAARLGIAPEVVHVDEADGLMLTRWVGREGLSAARLRDEPGLLAGVAATLGRLHRSGVRFRDRCVPLDLVGRHLSAAGTVPGRVRALVAAAELAWSAGGGGGRSDAPCHNDPWPSNFVVDDDRLWLVDWEYSAMGDPVWDLVNVSAGAGLDAAGDRRLVEAYGGPDVEETTVAIARLRPVCDLMVGAWALAQHAAGNRSSDYRAYAEEHLDRAAEGFATT